MIPELRILLDGLERVGASVASLTADTDGEQLAAQPAPGANSRAWLIWHLTRVMDHQGLSALAGLHAAGRTASVPEVPEQVWTAQGFAERFGLPYSPDASGYGQSAADVAAFPAVDPALLADYHRAVQEALAGWLAPLGEEDLDAVIDEAWDPPVTARARFVSVLDDAARHIGQAEYVTGLLQRG